MVEQVTCPENDVLRRWLIGQVPAAEEQALSDHFASCESCETRLESIEATLAVFEVGDTDADLQQVNLFNRFAGLARETDHDEPLATATLPHIAGYEIIKEVGRGGMGIVYEAIHSELNRRVAVKVLPTISTLDAVMVQRFEAEAQAAANLHHSNIIPVYEFANEGGCCYFSMQLIDGAGLDETNQLPRSATIERYHAITAIGIQVASAIAYAHAKGVIHRDIKPSNLLLDGDGIVWVSDFGLAKTQDSRLTQSGAILGTIRYMAPERFRGAECDELGDVYSLGATLYEILADQPAFPGDDYLETIEAISRDRPRPLRSIHPNIPRDLQTIVQKAMHHDPAMRYVDCGELQSDLQRFLDGRPITARPVSSIERLWLWSRANRSLASALAAISFLLFAGAVISAFAAIYFYEQKEVQVDLVKTIEAKSAENRENLYLAEMNLASPIASSNYGVDQLCLLVDHWQPVGDEEDLRGWEWFFFDACCRESRMVISDPGLGLSIDWHPENDLLLVGGFGTVLLFDAQSGERIWFETFDVDGHGVVGVQWSPDGRNFAASSLSGKVCAWRLADKKQFAATSVDAPVGSVCWNNNGQFLLFRTHSPDSAMYQWHPESDSMSRIMESAGVDPNFAFGFDCNGARLAATTSGQNPELGAIAIFDTHSEPGDWDLAARGDDLLYPISSIAWKPDGKAIANAAFDGVLRLWSPSGNLVSQVAQSNKPLVALEWNPKRPLIATAGYEGLVTVVSESFLRQVSGSPLTLPTLRKGHLGKVLGLSWNSAGTQLATIGDDHTVRIWDTSPPAIQRFRLPVEQGGHPKLQWGDHREQLYAMIAGHYAAWNVDTGKLLSNWYGGQIYESYDGSYRLISAADRRFIENHRQDVVHSLNQGRPFISHSIGVQSDWSPNRHVLAVVDRIGNPRREVVRLVTIGDDEAIEDRSIIEGERVNALLWHPQKNQIAVSYLTGDISGAHLLVICDANTGRVLCELHRAPSPVHAIAWSPDGTKVAYGGEDGTIRISDSGTGRKLAEMKGHTQTVQGLDWHPDGSRVVSASADGTVKFWNPESGQCTASLPHSTEVLSAAWDKSGQRLAVLEQSGLVTVRRSTTPQGTNAAEHP